MTTENELDFDVTKAVASLAKLENELGKYSKAMRASIVQITQLNKVQASLDQILENSVTKAERQAKAQERLAAARKKNADATIAQQKGIAAGANIKSQLGVDRTKANVPNLVKFDAATAAFEKLVAQTGAGEAAVKRILNNLSGDYQGAERRIRDAIVRILQAQEKLGGANAAKARAALAAIGQEVKSVKQAASALFLSWQSVTRIFIGQAIFRTVSAITREIRESVNTAKDLQTALAEIQTLAPQDLRGGDQKAVGKITRDISNEFGIDQIESARAVYEAFSNQVGNTAEVINFMGTSAQFAKATLTDLGDTQDLLSGVINAYDLSNQNAQRSADLLFKTIDLGRVRGEELANTFGRVGPLAAQLGVDLEEVLSALALTTIQGVKTDDALTQIQNIMKGLIKPTDALKQRFAELGVAGAEVGIAQFGLVGFIEKITEGSKSTEELSKFFDDIRELRGVLSVLTGEGKKFDDILKEITHSSEGAAAAAAKIVLDTPAQELERSIQQFRNFFTEEVGNTLISTLNVIIKTLGGAENAARVLITALVTGAITATAVLGGQLLVSLGTLVIELGFAAEAASVAATAMIGFQTVLGIGIGVAVIGGLIALGAHLIDISDAATQMAKSFEEAQEATKEYSKIAIAEGERRAREAIESADVEIKAALEVLAAKKRATADSEANALRAEKNITKSLKSQVADRLKAIESFISDVEDSIQESVDNIRRLEEDTRDVQFQVNVDRTQRNIDQAPTDDAKASALIKRVGELLKAQDKALKLNESDFATKISDEAFRVATQLADLDGKRAAGEKQIDKVLEARKVLNETLIQQETLKSTAAENSLTTLEDQNAQIEQQVSKFNELIEKLSKGDVSQTTRDKIQQELSTVGNEIQQSLINFGAEGLRGFDKQLSEIREEFTALDGTKIELDLLVDNSLEKVKRLLAEVQFSAELELKFTEASGIPGGRDQVTGLQNRLAELGKTFKNQSEKIVGLDAEEKAVRELIKAYGDEVAILQELAAQSVTRTEAEVIGGGAGGAVVISQKVDIEATKELLALFQEIEKTSFIGVNDIEALQNLSITLSKFDQAKKGDDAFSRVIPALAEIQKVNDALAVALDTLQKTQALSAEAAATKAEIDRISELTKEVQATENLNAEIRDTANAASQGIDPAIQKGAAFLGGQKQQIQAQQQLNDLIRQQPAPSGPVQNKSLGGIIYRANGGFVPRGTDTVPAMLTPGEMVISASNTRKFYSELMSINSGMKPQYRAEGGVVTSNSFGDININLPPGSNQADGRAAVTAIRREFRRKSSSRL